MASELERVIKVNTSNWNTSVLKSDIPVLVDFWAEWCGPCRLVGPIVEELSHSLEGKVKIAKLNVDQNQEIAIQYNVNSIPSLVLFKDGNEIDRTIGISSREKYEHFVKTALNL
ncbi:MAG: thioredoxin [Nitrososphaeraceae archaeon]